MVGPAIGPLAEGESDAPGRMAEPEDIARHAERLLRSDSPLAGKRVLVTAGATRESIDPVRVLTNRSSGKMGYRLAEAAWARGAEVTLVSGPSAERAIPEASFHRVESVADLRGAVAAHLPNADVLVMAAAPADFRPAQTSAEKRPRQNGAAMLALEPTEDILSDTKRQRRPGAVVVGFALETGDAVARGQAKLERKDLDLIVVNDALEPGAGFEVDTNRVTLLHRDGRRADLPLASKAEVAEAILDAVEKELERRTPAVSPDPG
jgi:phosphopantothenoylcysteine decarboxylase/phosphopantothenate--cysteine ligase